MRIDRILKLAAAAGLFAFGLLLAASASADTLLGPDDFEAGFGNWTNASGDVFDWAHDSAGTPSDNTGPSGDHTSGSGYYLFTEASSPRGEGDDAILESPCIDLTGASEADLDFWYHMYGAGMGTLEVQVASSTGASCASLGGYAGAFSVSGNQGDLWTAANISLDAFTGGSIQIRIIGAIGSSYQSDMAIDDVEVTATLGPECVINEDCDDLDDCTDDVCNAGTCEHTNTCGFRFSAIADPRDFSGPDHDTVDYLRGACEAMDALGSGDFMVSPGDIDHPPEPPGSPGDVYWTIEKYMGTGFLWYPGAGNHEAETSSDMAWLRALNPGGNTLPNVVNVGPGGPGPSGSEETTYSFDYGGVHFVQINQYYDGSSDAGTTGDVTDALYNWLQADLIATSQPLILVLGHEPAWPQPDADSGRMRHLGDSLDQYPSNRDRFWSLLRQHDVDAYICGHSHNFSAVNIDGVWQLDVGHARGIGDTGAMSTFVLTDVVDDTVTYQAYRGSGSGGVYSLTHSDLLACEGCDTYLFQDGVFPGVAYSGTRDTYIESASIHGGDTTVSVDGSPDASAILEWDVSAVPTGGTVLRAWITLNVQNTSADSYEIYEMKRDWVESEANWSDYASGGSWEVAGASGANDRGATVLGEVTARSDYSNNYILSLNSNGIALVQSWIDSPTTNHGVIISDYAHSDSVVFDSRDGGTDAYHPKLAIWYQNAPAGVCGDGTPDPGEDCDDGNTDPGDCCSATCQYESAATECRAPAGVCDAADYCDGAGACEADAKLTSECRAAVGICDVAEVCDGVADDCPADVFEPVTTECRASVGVCDAADYCDGAGACEADAKLTSECRASTGICDVAEFCDSVADDCPADAVAPATSECRAPAGVCDAADYCDGVGKACTADVKLTSECRAAMGVCDVAEVCDGAADDCPADVFAPATTECRASAGVCDAADYCDGVGACEADAKLTSECRASQGICDVAEVCDSVENDCPADAFEPATTECRPSAGECDVAETCSGAGPACPADGFEPSGTACGDPGDTVCDDPDDCDAVGNCQTNYEPPSTLCRAAVDVCDAPDYCDGASAACPADAKLTTECRPSIGPCDAAEMCNGVWDYCPVDRPANGLPCPDGDLCNGDEICVAWTCLEGAPCDCDDGDNCTIDSCDALQGCVNEPIVGGPLGCGRTDVPSASPAGRLLLSLLLVVAGATFLAWRRRSGT